MDERFPKYLQVICKKLDFLSIPNLGMLLAGLAVLGFAGHLMGAPLERFTLNPYLIMQGEVWRLITFPLAEVPTHPIWLLFHCLFIYFVMNSLESHWGVGPLTIYTLFCYICAIGGAFFVSAFNPLLVSIPVWQFLLFNMLFAFGTFFPDVEIILLIIPAKAKYLAYIFAALFLWNFITAGMLLKVLMLITITPYLIFFSPMFYKAIMNRRKTAQRRKKFNSDMWK